LGHCPRRPSNRTGASGGWDLLQRLRHRAARSPDGVPTSGHRTRAAARSSAASRPQRRSWRTRASKPATQLIVSRSATVQAQTAEGCSQDPGACQFDIFTRVGPLSNSQAGPLHFRSRRHGRCRER
jgi:hypothetical protein